MKKIYCELHIFDLEQRVYMIDNEAGIKDIVAVATAEELPATISALCAETGVTEVALGGNSAYSALIGEDIVTYSKLNYSTNNEIKVEVVK